MSGLRHPSGKPKVAVREKKAVTNVPVAQKGSAAVDGTTTVTPDLAAAMKTRHKSVLVLVCALFAVLSCDNPREEFHLVQEVTGEDLRMGLSFDLNMEEGYSYTAAVMCRVDATASVKEDVDIDFEVISPAHASYKESVSFPLVGSARQRATLPEGSQVLFKKRGTSLDNQWGWRRGITCDSIPGRWLVIISVRDSTDLKRIRAIGFSYKGQRDEQEQTF